MSSVEAWARLTATRFKLVGDVYSLASSLPSYSYSAIPMKEIEYVIVAE